MTAFKPTTSSIADDRREVLYRGPYREVADESGRVFRRGARISVSGQTFERLREGPQAADFVFLDPPVEACHEALAPEGDRCS